MLKFSFTRNFKTSYQNDYSCQNFNENFNYSINPKDEELKSKLNSKVLSYLTTTKVKFHFTILILSFLKNFSIKIFKNLNVHFNLTNIFLKQYYFTKESFGDPKFNYKKFEHERHKVSQEPLLSKSSAYTVFFFFKKIFLNCVILSTVPIPCL